MPELSIGNELDLQKLFKKIYDAAHVIAEFKSAMDQLIIEKYGYHYSDKDLDTIIECLDYGVADCTYNEFNKMMLGGEEK